MKFLTPLALALALVGLTVADDKKAALDPQKIVGDWSYVSGAKMGDKIDKERLVGTVVITKDAINLPAENNQKFVMPYTINTKTSPAEIDLEIKEGPVGVGGKAKGIIALEKDELKICYAPEMGAEAKRPTKFESTKDNGAFLFVLKRAKK